MKFPLCPASSTPLPPPNPLPFDTSEGIYIYIAFHIPCPVCNLMCHLSSGRTKYPRHADRRPPP